MKELNIGRTIIRKRKERGLTQEDVANFIGVSKASVSKWETGHSYPDVVYLPQLAAYFGVSLDELMGYNPQMTDEEIRRIYYKLLDEFSTQPFHVVKNHCIEIAKEYYSCYPLLYQISTLILNYCTALNDDSKKTSAIQEAKNLFMRVKHLSEDIELKQLALHSEAVCEMMLENPNQVIELLKNKKINYNFQPSIGAMLANSYQETGKPVEAKLTLQDSLLISIISFFCDAAIYLSLCTDNKEHFEVVCKRTIEMGHIFKINDLFPIAILSFYLNAAEGYIKLSDIEKALTMLENYLEIAISDINLISLKGDDFFTLLEKLLENQKKELPYMFQTVPGDVHTLKQILAASVMENSVFEVLFDEPRFKIIAEKLGG